MTFQKPKDVKYVDMCIFVDEKVQQESISEEDASLVYEYLYHIIYMLAVKQRFFSKEEYYDEFAIITAGDVFNRLITNPKLQEVTEDGTPKMAKVKSCLNYIKAILYGRKVHFEQSYYSQKFLTADPQEIPSTTSSFSYTRDSLDFKINLNTELYLDTISGTIKSYIRNNSPYRKNRLLMKNIYISCLLSILNSLVFTEEENLNIQRKYTTMDAKVRYLYKAYKLNRDNCITLYHLPGYYRSYITVLVRQLYTVIGKDIKELCHSDISIPEDVLMNISFMEIMGNEYDN